MKVGTDWKARNYYLGMGGGGIRKKNYEKLQIKKWEFVAVLLASAFLQGAFNRDLPFPPLPSGCSYFLEVTRVV